MSAIGDAVETIRERVERRGIGDPALIVGTMAALYLAYILVGSIIGFDLNGQVNALQRITFLTAVFSVAGLALNLHWGYTGLFNVGIAGFMAIGVYVMGIATAPVDPGSPTALPGLGLPMPVGVVLGVLAAALAGLVISLPALRLRADYLAIVTLGFSEIVRLSVSSATFQEFTLFGRTMGTGGSNGLSLAGDPSAVVRTLYDTGFGITPLKSAADGIVAAFAAVGIERAVVINITYTVVIVVVLGLVYALVRRLGNSPFGRVLRAIREDEDVAQSLGKDTRLLKMKSFVIGCGLLGFAAIIWQGSRGLATPNTFMTQLTVFVWVVVTIGGSGSNTGTVLGAALFVGLLREGPRFLRDAISATVDLPRAPSNVFNAVAALGDLDPTPLVSYVFGQLGALQFVLLGVVLIVVVKRRPEGVMGHRKEPAAAIDITRPREQLVGNRRDDGTADTTGEGEANEGESDD
jgi:branched-chain amino acid transport system permease protein